MTLPEFEYENYYEKIIENSNLYQEGLVDILLTSFYWSLDDTITINSLKIKSKFHFISCR